MTIKGILNSCLYEDKNYDYVANQLAELCNQGKTDGKHIQEIYRTWAKTHYDEVMKMIANREQDQWFFNDLESELREKVFCLKNNKDLFLIIARPNQISSNVMSYAQAQQYLNAKEIKLQVGNSKIFTCKPIGNIQTNNISNGYSQRITNSIKRVFHIQGAGKYIELAYNNMGGISELSWKLTNN